MLIMVSLKNNRKKVLFSVLTLIFVLFWGYFIYKFGPKFFVSEGEDVRSKNLSKGVFLGV